MNSMFFCPNCKHVLNPEEVEMRFIDGVLTVVYERYYCHKCYHLEEIQHE